MAKSQRGLGRGYSALISSPLPTPATESEPDAPLPPATATEVPLDLIDPCPLQPRKHFRAEALESLAQSIKEQGLIQPLVVRRVGERYELIAGERRWRALQRLGAPTAPVVLKDVVGDQRLEMALVENLQRADLDPLETAAAYQALLAEGRTTQEKLAERLGVSRPVITNALRLLGLPAEIRSWVADGALSESHARLLLKLPDHASQLRVAKKVVDEGLNVRQTEALTEPTGRRKPSAPSADAPPADTSPAGPETDENDPHVRDLSERLTRHLGVRAVVRDRGGRGVIEVHYTTPAESALALARMGISLE